MAFADLTKQLAQQAILSAAKDPPPPIPAPGEPAAGPVILAQIGLMQRALKEDEELIVLYHAAGERIRVLEIFLPSPEVAVLSGTDANRAPVRAIAPAASLALLCKTVKVPPPAKPARVSLVVPKPK
ncbi:MAG TPA: hypothetical protein VGE89_09995 [Bryobacteraceae bacterium]|jgi:hypothetical protein